MYSDGGGWCFGCGLLIPSTISGYIYTEEKEDARYGLYLPPDSNQDYPPEVMDWVHKYGINASILKRKDVYWSPSRKHLMFTWWNESTNPRTVVAYQARTFKKGQPKYLNFGDFEELIAKYRIKKDENSNILCIVEDCLSAIKISHTVCDTVACLTSELNRQKLVELANEYNTIVIWLDDNMYKKALRIQETLDWLGPHTAVIQSTGDPKDHRYSDISSMINWSYEKEE